MSHVSFSMAEFASTSLKWQLSQKYHCCKDMPRRENQEEGAGLIQPQADILPLVWFNDFGPGITLVRIDQGLAYPPIQQARIVNSA